MSELVVMRRARDEGDVQLVAAMWTRAAAWLGARGLDQWQYPVRVCAIRESAQAGTCWLAERDGQPVGTITLNTVADQRFWWPEDDPASALYVHRMVAESRGTGLGTILLEWAAGQAREQGRAWLRLDAWRTNLALHRYYLDRGFQFVRLVAVPGACSGACFQRAATASVVEAGVRPVDAALDATVLPDISS